MQELDWDGSEWISWGPWHHTPISALALLGEPESYSSIPTTRILPHFCAVAHETTCFLTQFLPQRISRFSRKIHPSALAQTGKKTPLFPQQFIPQGTPVPLTVLSTYRTQWVFRRPLPPPREEVVHWGVCRGRAGERRAGDAEPPLGVPPPLMCLNVTNTLPDSELKVLTFTISSEKWICAG